MHISKKKRQSNDEVVLALRRPVDRLWRFLQW